ncbi:LOW QUALITY PROTEIN: BAHD acyltransferase BIA1 [Raphanus sativus]|uniref:LOW QUALITY PROTEIN: BAHD acyltransferase BIA1 n=1 Tax=Raphanus sativus TaxID=3726 RepID=A0A6J0NP51_RAPSA|nr:LOW QUALITY PROTEIN: BAHD acyltransferase BIA1 [Raphanus sativus]
MTLKMEFVGEEVIKPSSPTPNHLQRLHLSLFDQFLPPTYQTVVLFYDKESEFDQKNPKEDIIGTNLIQRLKSSLSHTLTRFYPLAGRIHGVTVDCNDEGVLFTEARTDVPLSDFLGNPRYELLQQLIAPSKVSDPGMWPLLRVKISWFRNSGFAVAIGVSHKVCDTTSLGMFISDWTTAAKGNVLAVNPYFESPIFYPPGDLSINLPPTVERTSTLTKRFVFGPAKIKELKSKASSKLVTHATRNEATTALLLTCMMRASRSKADAIISQTMDLRARVPSNFLSGKSIGNFFFLPTIKESTEKEIELQDIVFKLRNNKKELDELIKEDSDQVGERLMSAMLSRLYEMSPEMETYVVTSWCRMPFYGADFGLGTPVWVAADSIDKTQVVLVDANDGEGIEAWVTLPEDDMFAFEHDKELLEFAST